MKSQIVVDLGLFLDLTDRHARIWLLEVSSELGREDIAHATSNWMPRGQPRTSLGGEYAYCSMKDARNRLLRRHGTECPYDTQM